MIPLPWRLLGGLVIALALFFSGYGGGYKHAQTECVAGQVEAQRAAGAEAAKEDLRRETVGTARETTREQIRIVYKTIKEQARETVNHHPEFNDCGLDADGLRLWNAANSGEAAPVPGEPYLSMHRAATSARPAGGGEIGQPGGSADQPHRGDGAVQPVPGSADETGRVQQPTPALTLPLQEEETNVKGL